MKRLAAVVVAAGALLGVSAPAALAAGPSLCVNGSVTVNGTTQTVDQCVPGN